MKKFSDILTPGAIWITGITASGKTTIAELLHNELLTRNIDNVIHLDGDELRKHLKKDYDHSLDSRLKVAAEYIEIVEGYVEREYLVIISTVSHKKIMRENARSRINMFMEVFLSCPPKICEQRDYKGLYSKAIKGEIILFPGITEPYEESDISELVLNTGELSAIECSEILLKEVLTFFSTKIYVQK